MSPRGPCGLHGVAVGRQGELMEGVQSLEAQPEMGLPTLAPTSFNFCFLAN